MRVHLVFPSEYIEALEPVLIENGITVTEKDSTIDTFSQWATSQNECKSDLAFIYGSGTVSTSQSSFSQKQAIYERLKEVRISRQSLKLIVIFPKVVEQDKAFISKLVQLGIYDLYFSDEMSVDDILNWFNQSRTLADVQELIGDYWGRSEEIAETVQIKQPLDHSIEYQMEEMEDDKEQKSRRFNFKIPTLPKPHLKSRKEKEEPEIEVEDEIEGETKKRKLSIDFRLPSLPITQISQRKTTLLQPKTIAVASFHGGAGSTFLIYNLTSFLSKQNIVSGVLETSTNSMIWYQIGEREGVKLQNFDSWCNQVLRNSEIKHSAKIQIDNTHIIPFHPNDKIDELKIEHIQSVVQAAKKVPFLFIDLSSDWNNPLAEEAIKNCDEIWFVTRPDPNYLFSQQKQKKTFLSKAIQYVGGDNAIFIGNGWEKGVDDDNLPVETFVNIPYFSENIQALMEGLPLYEIKPRLLEKHFDKLKDRLFHEMGKVPLYQ